MTQCPSCGSWRLHRSHTKWWERPAKLLVRKRPFACFECHWRGWLPLSAVIRSQVVPLPVREHKDGDPDLTKVDELLTGRPPEPPPQALV